MRNCTGSLIELSQERVVDGGSHCEDRQHVEENIHLISVVIAIVEKRFYNILRFSTKISESRIAIYLES